MKTKLLFILILIISTEKSFSQEYIPLLNNSSWVVDIADFAGVYSEAINPNGDQVIGQYIYKKYIDESNQEFLLREDIVSRKVYKIIGGNDVLLFDFSLNVSDNITLGNGDNFQVTSISNVNINDGQRRQFILQNTSNPFGFNEVWIEGVGSKLHPLLASYELLLTLDYSLKCSFQNGVNIYNFGLAGGLTATDCMSLGIETESHLTKKINFTPNPFQTELIISTKTSLKDCTLKMYNSIGQIVKQINNINSQEIILKRESLNCGLYLIEIFEKEKLVTSNKVLITN